VRRLRIFGHALPLGYQDFRIFWSSGWMWLLTHVLRVMTTAAMWVLLGRLVESEDHVRFLLIGQVAIVGAQYSGWAVSAFTWDRMYIGTYPVLVAAPASLVPVMMGRTAVWMLNGVVTAWVTFAILVPLFRLPVSWSQAVWALPAIALVPLSAWGLAFALGAVINWIPRLRNIAHNSVTILMMTICGVVVPVAFWPGWVQGLASVLPVTHGLAGIRLILEDGMTADALANLALEAAVGLAWLVAGMLILDRTVDAARRSGKVDLI
jgi:ABC-2 type transport system permease protein